MGLNRRGVWGAVGSLLLALALACGGGSDNGVTKAKEPSVPVITSFVQTFPASDVAIHLGDVPRFKTEFSGGAATITDKVGTANAVAIPVTITSGVEFSVPPVTGLGKHTYTLTVTGSAGTTAPAKTVTAPLVVTVAGAISAIMPADGYQTATKTVAYTATVVGVTDPTLVWSTSGNAGAWSGNKWTAVNWVGTYTITAAATDGSTASTTVHVVNMPSGSVLVSAFQPKYGAIVTVTPSYGAGTATLGLTQGGTELATSIGTGTQIQSAPIKGPTTFWLRVTNQAGDYIDASATVTPQVVVVSPISPAGPSILLGTPITFSATASGGTDNTLTWTATGPGATGGPAGTWAGTVWTPPAVVGDYTITATANADGKTSQSTTVHVVDSPAIQAFTASMNPVPYGGHAALTATFTNGAGAVDQGIGAVTSGTPFDTGALTSSKTYALTVLSPTGKSVSKPLDLGVQTLAVGAVTPAVAQATSGASIVYQATVTNAVDSSLLWSASGGVITTDGIWRAPATPGTYSITAASKAVPTVKSSTTVTVVAGPVATSLTATNGTVLYGSTAQLTPVFSGGAGIIDNGLGQVTSGTPVATGAVLGATTFTLSVQDSDTSHQTNLMANGDAEAGPLGASIGANVGVVQDSGHARSGSWTRAFPLVAVASANYHALQGVVPITPGQTIEFDAWVRSSSDITQSAPNIQLVWTDVTGAPMPGKATVAEFAPKASGWQGVTVVGTAPAGAAGFQPAVGLAAPADAGDVGQTIYLDDLVVKHLARAATTVKTADIVITAVSPANASLTIGKSQAYSATVSGSLNSALAWTATGPGSSPSAAGTWTGTTWVAPSVAGVYTITASSAANANISASTSVTVVDAPAIQGLTVATNPVPSGQATTITARFTGGQGAVTMGSGQGTGNAVVSGTPFSTGPLTADTQFTLTVANTAKDTVQASVVVHVKSGVMSPLLPSMKADSLTRGFQVLGGVITGSTDTVVIWSVNGVDGGNSAYGTISATGAYMAPNTMPGSGSTAQVTVMARSATDPTLHQAMTVSLWRLPSITSFTVK